MDRILVYPQELPRTADFLGSEKNTLYAVGYLAQSALGTGTCVIGLVGAQTTIPSLQITIGSGAIFSNQPVDATAYAGLGTDANTVVKQGILKAAQTLTLTAPTTSGYSQVYLVEAAYQDIDGGSTVLPYYNSSNPAAPYAGPGNAGTSNYTVRQGACVITLKAGTAAPTGSQTVPATDSGYVPLYTVTVANGQTGITTAQIIVASGAPFVPYNLNNLPTYFATASQGTTTQTYSTPGTYTFTPTRSGWHQVEVVGGGGGSGGCTGLTNNCGSSGGAGGRAIKWVNLTAGVGVTVTVGAAGAAGTGSPLVQPTAGGTSSFGAYVSATGGGAGQSPSGALPTVAGLGGAGVSGDVSYSGGNGGLYWSGTASLITAAPAATAAGNATSQPSSGTGAGYTGINPGDAGIPAVTSTGGSLNGGAGAPGRVIIHI